MLLQCTLSYGFDVNGWPAEKGEAQKAGWATVSPGFFEALRIQVKRGRPFSSSDDDKGANVAIINETMARKFWKDRDPLRDRIVIYNTQLGVHTDPERQIVGVVADVGEDLLNRKEWPIMYVPAAQVPTDDKHWHNTNLAWVIRTLASSQSLIPAIRDDIRRATGLPAGQTHSMPELVSASLQEQQLSMLLMSLFGLSAILLAAVGIYGVMSSIVQQRTQEIGIRMALGAHATQVRNMVVREGAVVTAAGIVIGLAVSWLLARSMEGLLFGVKSHDPIVFVSVPLFLGTVALLAVWIPASRASRVNPVESLRCE
jgi:predicted permease